MLINEVKEIFPKEKQVRLRQLLVHLTEIAPGSFEQKISSLGRPKFEAQDEHRTLTVRVTKTLASSKSPPIFVAVVNHEFVAPSSGGDSDERDRVRELMTSLPSKGFPFAFAPDKRGNMSVGIDTWQVEL